MAKLCRLCKTRMEVADSHCPSCGAYHRNPDKDAKMILYVLIGIAIVFLLFR